MPPPGEGCPGVLAGEGGAFRPWGRGEGCPWTRVGGQELFSPGWGEELGLASIGLGFLRRPEGTWGGTGVVLGGQMPLRRVWGTGDPMREGGWGWGSLGPGWEAVQEVTVRASLRGRRWGAEGRTADRTGAPGGGGGLREGAGWGECPWGSEW